GRDTIDLQATSTATAQGNIRGFKWQNNSLTNPKLLPFALQVDTWMQVVNGSGPDDFTRDTTTGAVTSGSGGIHECKLYPISTGASGNFGTVDLGAPNNSTADLSRQVLNGPNAADFAYFPNSTIQLDPETGTLILQGDTGVSAGVKDELASIIGEPRIIPLYSTVTGNGNNAQYTIVGFAGVTITEVVLTGSLSSKHLTIQPCFVVDSTAIPGASGGSTSWFVTRPVALTR